MSLFGELKRRNVFRVAVAYALASWVLLQIIEFVLDAIEAPQWILQVFMLAAAAGFLVVVVFSWAFEVTSEGIKREKDIDRSQSITPQTGRKLDRIIIGFLTVVIGLLVIDRFFLDEAQVVPLQSTVQTESLDIANSPSSKSIAVLPFLALSSGPDDGYFADGLTEEILNSLAQLPELLVTSRTSAFHFKGKDVPVPEIAAALGVANIVEGSVRRAGDRLRVTAQLIRANDGFHLWSENYDSDSDDAIAVQEDIAEKIASAMNVVMDDHRREVMRRAGLRDVEAFIALQKGFALYNAAHGDPDMFNILRQANEQFEIVMERAPGFAPAYEGHADFYVHVLLSAAGGISLDGATEQDIAEASDRMANDFAMAVQYSSNPEQRLNAELDQAFVTGNWRGMSARIERSLEQDGCDAATWVDFLAMPFGYAERMAVRSNETRICDPLFSYEWISEARALLWAGNKEAALDTALQGDAIAPSDYLNGVIIRARIANGQYDLAMQDISTRLDSGNTDDGPLMHWIMLAAAEGNPAKVATLIEQYQDGPTSGFNDLLYYAWSGSREYANRMAAGIDAKAMGAIVLTTIINWCMCGAPWDLSATPNFAALIDESGLTWPPLSPLTFPMKDW